MDCPKLRPVEAFPAEVGGQQVVCLRDPYGFSDRVLLLPHPLFFIVSLFDGRHSLLDIQAAFARRNGELLFREELEEIVRELDAAHFLEGSGFEAHRERVEADFARSHVRRAALAGKSYEADPGQLRIQIDRFFEPPDGPGRPQSQDGGPQIKGAVIPHIDFARGGPCYGWAYKALLESCDADLFVVLGTSHTGTRGRFALTRKDYDTPFGVMPTDRSFVDRLISRCGPSLLLDEQAHRAEHSIEFQATLLQGLLGAKRTVQMVPILCLSFHSLIASSGSPSQDSEVAAFIEALGEAIATSGRRCCLIASADLAHVGPRFGDHEPVDNHRLREVAQKDLTMLERVVERDAEGFFAAVQAEEDRLRICGLSSIYTLLGTLGAGQGKLLNYSQWPDPSGTVTFASVIFY
jgi:AmmeMemoRadiSam system protein B